MPSAKNKPDNNAAPENHATEETTAEETEMVAAELKNQQPQHLLHHQEEDHPQDAEEANYLPLDHHV